MNECVFCQIVEGKIPCYKVWENENFLAFLDIKPLAVGHTLIIPKKHFRWVWEVEDYDRYWEKTREVKNLLEQKLQTSWVEIRVLGMDVAHAHIHLIPHYQEKESKVREIGQVASLFI